jgi:hypothetical protein
MEDDFYNYVTRVFRLRQMSFDYAIYQMISVCFRPSKMYQLTALNKEARQYWARDDPAFMILLVAGLAVSALAYTVAFGSHFYDIFRILIQFIVIHFFGTGLLMSYANYIIANKYLRNTNSCNEGKSNSLEFLYCFDIHCNSFFPMFVLLYVVQFFLIPVLDSDNFLSVFVANLMYGFSFSYYHFITCKGFSALVFLKNTEVFLLPIVVFIPVFVLFTIMRLNPTSIILSLYF